MLHAAAVHYMLVWANSRTTCQHSSCYFPWRTDEYSHTDWNITKHKHYLCQRKSFYDCNKFQSLQSCPSPYHKTLLFLLIFFPISRRKWLNCQLDESIWTVLVLRMTTLLCASCLTVLLLTLWNNTEIFFFRNL